MIENSYVGLLDSDTIVVKHPISKNDVKLYRIIALKSFRLDRFDSNTLDLIDKHEKEFLNLHTEFESLKTQQEDLQIVIEKLTSDGEHAKVKEHTNTLTPISKRVYELENDLNEVKSKLEHYKSIVEKRTIEIHSIGGYVQSIDNLDPDVPVWVDHRSRVFDNAKILNGSLITESCVIFGDAVVNASRLKNYARVHGKSEVMNSYLEGLCEVKGNAKLNRCQLSNSAMIFEDAIVENSILSTGTCIRGKSQVSDSILNDASQIQGETVVKNCRLSGRYVILEGEHVNQSYFEDYNLKTEYHGE